MKNLRVMINKNIAISETGFVFNPLTGDSFSTNAVGRIILSELQKDSSIDEIKLKVTTEFAVDKSTLERDIDDFMMMLKSYQIIRTNE
jgi:hypothetical protein